MRRIVIAGLTCLMMSPAVTSPPTASAQEHCNDPAFGEPLPVDVTLSHGLSTGNGVGIVLVDTGVSAPGVHTDRAADRDRCLLHGTAVAGVLRHIAPEAALVSVRQDTGAGADATQTTVADLVIALDRARDTNESHRVRIVNISVVACEDTAELRRSVTAAQDAGLLIVAAAGNTGQCGDGQVPYPAALPGVLAVGGVEMRNEVAADVADDLNAGRRPADYSIPGPWVDLHAPGGPVSAPLRMDDGTVRTIVGDPSPFTGTSFAAPVVAATAALVWQLRPELTALEVRDVLVSSAQTGVVDVVDPAAAVTTALDGTGVGRTAAAPLTMPGSVPVENPAPAPPDLRIPAILVTTGAVGVLGATILRGIRRQSSGPGSSPGPTPAATVMAARSWDNTPPSGNGSTTR
jgi:membrane-anchored mycosin MYCP